VKRITIVFLSVVFFVCIVGCATNKDLRAVNLRLSSKINSLEKDLSQLKSEYEKLREGIGEVEKDTKNLRKTQADSGADFSDLATQIRHVRGEVETLGNELKNLRTDMTGSDTAGIRQKYDDISFRINYIENYLGLGKKPVSEEKKPAVKRKEKTSLKKAVDKDNAYSEAYKLFKEGSYESARNRFQEFVKIFPDTEYSDNAQFWIAECYYFETNYEKAILEYEKVIKDYPKGNKVPNALLKQSLSFLKLGDKSSAKLLLQRVIKEYPNTSPARIARGKLASIK